MNVSNVEVIDRTVAFQGHFRVDRYRLRYKLYEGGWSGEMTREIFERGHAVCVILYDPTRDAVVLVEQFRPGAMAALQSSPWPDAPFGPWLLECVAGIVEPGEQPEDVARRETREEAGCQAEDLFLLFRYLASPGGSSESIAVYCGRVDSTSAHGIHGLTSEHENIRVVTMPLAQAFQAVHDGKVVNSMTLISLQWLERNVAMLRARWPVARQQDARP